MHLFLLYAGILLFTVLYLITDRIEHLLHSRIERETRHLRIDDDIHIASFSLTCPSFAGDLVFRSRFGSRFYLEREVFRVDGFYIETRAIDEVEEWDLEVSTHIE